jgi:CYTH domain-containing protein
MAKKLEIERKYLLKRLPNLRYDKVLEMTQHYLDDGSRIRESQVISGSKPSNKKSFFLTKKKKIKMGVYEEDEKLISEKQFNALVNKSESVMKKTRYIYKAGSLKWEIDVYQIKMVTAEIELPREDYPFRMPAAIKKELIMDVTEFPQFTSRKLSDPV